MIDAPIINQLQGLADKHRLKVLEIDHERPWGGEFIFGDQQVPEFVEAFFPKLNSDEYMGRLATPKFLIIAPGQRFSWQYHNRRGELWSIVLGPIGLVSGNADQQGEPIIMNVGEEIFMEQGIRHRLVSQDNWGVVAELWVHVDPSNPSTEDDNIRVADDYNRQ